MKKTIKCIFVSAILVLILNGYANAQMFWNQTASFAGNNTSYISIPNSGTLDITGSFTIEAWINPTSLSGASKGILSKGTALGTSLKYAIRLTTAGRIALSTNGAQKLISRISNPVSLNNWTHVSAAYNSSTSLFSIYLNGILDTSSIVGGATPTSNSDSLFAGISGSSTPFNGKLDEVRLWNRELSSTEIEQYFRTSLCASSGVYSGLILSMPFQKENSDGTLFTVRDLSGNNNNGNARNVTAIDQSFRPLQTISQNDNIELDGDEDYLAGKDTSTLYPTNRILLECYVYPRAVQTCNLITKGNQFALMLENNLIKASINGNTVVSNTLIPINQWSKITMQYNNGLRLHIDGLYTFQGFPSLGILTLGPDSIFIGGVPGATGDFNGFMDEVKIFNKFYQVDDSIYMMTYKSIDKSNAPSFAETKICYNLDGTLFDNADGGGPKLHFRNNAQFSHPGRSSSYKPVSPLNRDELNTLRDGYYLGGRNMKIPLSGSSGSQVNNIQINLNTIISDVDVFIALNHTNLSTLNITLTAPNGDSVRIAENLSTTTADNSLVTFFDDQADSSFASNKYVSFHTKMKPKNNMNSVFAGDNSLGFWRIRITDIASGDIGIMSMCGIKINNMPVIEYNFSLSNYIQGLYNPVINSTLLDTLTMYLRESFSPFAKVDSCTRRFNGLGNSPMSFINVLPNRLYYVQVNHRNSIETWSSTPIFFSYFRSTLSFHLSNATTYGNNVIQVDDSLVTFAMFSGDVDQDGYIDLNDVIDISNKAGEFATGYIVQDLTGDNITDLNDILIAYNNSLNFVHRMTPLD